MIYFFDNLGRCIQRMTQSGDIVEMRPLIQRHFDAMTPQNVSNWVCSADEHNLDDLAFVGGQMIVREPCPAMLDQSTPDIALFDGLPVGGQLIVNDTSYPITDTQAEVSIALPGTYVLTVRSIPYKDGVWTIVVP